MRAFRLPSLLSTEVSAGLVAAVYLLHSPAAAQTAALTNGPLNTASRWPIQPSSRRHPAYQVFAYRLALPSIAAATNQLLIIGGKCPLDLAHRDQIQVQLQPLAEQLGVPLGVMQHFTERLKTNAPASIEWAAQELRTTVIDYKFLQEKLNQYHPLPADEQFKAAALKSLQAGELETTWALFESLPKPMPPGGLRIVNPPGPLR